MSDPIFNSLLNSTCKIIRRSYNTSSIDKWGASTESFTTITVSEDCRFEQTDELIELSRRGEKIYTRLMVYFKPTANILEDDIIELNSKRYRVVSVSPEQDDIGIHHFESALINME